MALSDWLSPDRDFPPYVGPIRRYVILSSPRSGSTLLAECLTAAGAGQPLEYMHPRLLELWRRDNPGHDALDFVAAMEQRRTAPNGVFGSKIHFEHFVRAFPETLGATGFDWLRRQNALIRIYRRDRLAQAVSHARANMTGQWHSGDRSIRPFTFSGTTREMALLRRSLNRVVRDEVKWIELCAARLLRTLDIAYEDLRDNVRPTLGQALVHIGLPDNSAAIELPQMKPMADLQSASVREQFAAFLNGRD